MNNENEKDMLSNGYIKKYHLIYPLIIMTIIIVLLVSFIFKSSDYAGSMLSFAATLSSILLAVIAIIITLIDVAGQWNNIGEVKKSVQELGEVTEGLKELITTTLDTIDNRQNELSKITKELIERTESISSLETDEKVEELKNRLNKIQEFFQKSKDTQYLEQLSGSKTPHPVTHIWAEGFCRYMTSESY